MLSDRCLSVLSVLSVCDARALWPNAIRRTKLKLGMHLGLVPGLIVLNGDPAPLPKGAQPPQFSAHICWVRR